MPPADRRYPALAGEFEEKYLNQGGAGRTLEESMNLARRLFDRIPAAELTGVDGKWIGIHHRPSGETEEA